MTKTSRLIRIALIAGTALIGASAAWAQFPRSTEPMVLSGADVGFRVTGTDLRTACPPAYGWCACRASGWRSRPSPASGRRSSRRGVASCERHHWPAC